MWEPAIIALRLAEKWNKKGKLPYLLPKNMPYFIFAIILKNFDLQILL